MRLYTVVVLATAFLLGGSVTSALQPGQIALSETESVGAALQHDSAAKRSLRIRESTEDYQDEDDEEEDVDEEEEEEERGWLKSLKFLKWLKKGMNPKHVSKKLGLDGLGEKARDHPKYQTYLDYSRYWCSKQ
ncbi:hypothetical protein PHYSODRAFT_285701 [Phytophthora sojae]|uniref:RxLR effector protein n=2 Tax=Phytophthora sojae TaxID=67593 RepID=G4Z2R8_PHYSP|nr:hypothetical protein PHYSODRAFT_285701 [Phytophthora sojae]AEK80726.1 Avh138 [Phytophthora sojae]AEK80728.1 Avh138 [Phytophthora sojae]EGZ22193.1 hypothetical protein PHYSODRAFT_285701 [Phytophthora sojae]|eukprot:XP_009524910.1 hypothetical protein PHYSODRAFT_285701 [Phytophthora sojae]